MFRVARGALLLIWLLPTAFAFAQVGFGTADRYTALYGEPVDVTIDDLVQGGQSYQNRAIRTRGVLEVVGTAGGRLYSLRGSYSARVLVIPVDEISFEFEQQALHWLGGEVEVVGLYTARTQSMPGLGQPSGYIQFWSFTGPEEEQKAPPKDTRAVSLERLVTEPGHYDEKLVRVIGQFRGRNLYGDLPGRSGRSRSDWVIKDDLYAVWVTGKKPKGDGFELDAGLKRDTGKWLEVVGRPETVRGVTYIRASHVSLSAPPSPDAKVVANEPPPPPPRRPPVVVFSLPVEGEDVPTDSRFTVQFSKDMEVPSFDGRVVLRYVGPPQPGDRSFVGMAVSYDGGRKALTLDPGDRLRPGREIEMLLLPGITDLDGMTLVPRPDHEAVEGAVDVLRWYVAS
jgi:hypothetical protein